MITIAHISSSYRLFTVVSVLPSGSRPVFYHPYFHFIPTTNNRFHLRDNARVCLQLHVFFQPPLHFVSFEEKTQKRAAFPRCLTPNVLLQPLCWLDFEHSISVLGNHESPTVLWKRFRSVQVSCVLQRWKNLVFRSVG